MPSFWADLFENFLTQVTVAISVVFLVAAIVFVALRPRMVLLVAKNLGRNLVRTILTCVAIMALVFMITLILSLIHMLESQTREKSADFKLLVTERRKVPSQLPMTHADYLNPENAKFILAEDLGISPDDFMVWSFYGGTTDPAKFTPETLVFLFALNPGSILEMMDDTEDFDPSFPQMLIDNPRGCLMGRDRLRMLDKRVGERFTLTSLNFKEINLEFEILGELPPGRYDKLGIFNIDYLNRELDKYKTIKRQAHPLDQKRLNLIWMRVRDTATFEKVGSIVESAPQFGDRPVRCDMGSAAIGSFLEAFGDILRFFKWVLVPAILASMSLVVANAISITVRERRSEMAVLKVLGYRPNEILLLVFGESLLVGGLSGLLSGVGAVLVVNYLLEGISFPIAFFPVFFVPVQAIFWCVAMGAGTAFFGSFVPAYQARSVKVAEVFAKVA